MAEIRSRLIAGEPLVVEDLDVSKGVLALSWESVRAFVKGANYLWFLSEFIFKIECPQVSRFSQRSMPDKVYFELLPDGYRQELLQECEMSERGKIFYINDEILFWQKPTWQSQ